MDAREERVGRNEVLFREINERLKNVQEGFAAFSDRADFVCECGDSSCTAQITMSVAEYEQLRADPTTFAVVQGHEIPDVESVVGERGGYRIVRKREGGPAELAREEDPRS